MGDLAEAHAVRICFAYRESCSGQVHHSLQLVQADGRATANYRSTHLGRSAIESGLVPGNWLTTARLELDTTDEPVVLGLLAGIDHLAPEVARALSALGAQLLIAVIDHDERCAADLLGPLARLRAIENGVPVILVDPSGTVHAAAAGGGAAAVVEQAGILAVELDVDDQLHGNAEIGTPRRPDLYGQLTRGATR
jgi:predicted amidohydrolase